MIPLGTDAPLYHRPFGTVLLIVVNVAVFVGVGLPSGFEYPGWVLEYGSIDPVEWVAGNFIHFGFGHLLGNMIFLWGFGLLAEGKLGFWRFLGVYLLIGVATSAFEQGLMTVAGQGGGSGGASGVIFGLIAIAVIWAPKNEVSVLWILPVFRGFAAYDVFEVSVLTYGAWYIGWEVALALLTGLAPTSALLHVIGAVGGAIVGYVCLTRGWVDCENWDLIAWMNNTHGTRPGEHTPGWRNATTAASRPRPDTDIRVACEPKRKAKSAKPDDAIAQHLRAGDAWRAFSAWEYARAIRPNYVPPPTTAVDLAAALHREDAADEATAVLKPSYVAITAAPERFSPTDRIAFAATLAETFRRPSAAAKIIAGLDEAELDEADTARFARLRLAVRAPGASRP
ncbi:MAG: rhomboid family intramembrane serine protease [Planctomycetota bacterium]